MNYEIFSRKERWSHEFHHKIEILISRINNETGNLPSSPWVVMTSKSGSVKLVGNTGGIPIHHFSSYRNRVELFGFLSGVLYVLKYWYKNKPSIEAPIFITSYAPYVEVHTLLDYINYYEPPNGLWFVESNRLGMLSIRGGQRTNYYAVIDDYGNYFYSKREMYWLLVGVAYALYYLKQT